MVTYNAMGFRAPLNQAATQLGYQWEMHGDCRTGRKFQNHISFHLTPDSPPMFSVLGRAIDVIHEVYESALVHALIYIDEGLGYNIGDLNYNDYIHVRNRRAGG